MKKIYVNKAAIDRIKAGGPHEPCIVIREGLRVQHATEVRVNGPCRFVSDHAVTEGPSVWAETEASVSCDV